MDEWSKTATSNALHRTLQHGEHVGMLNVDESTYRMFFMESLRVIRPGAMIQSEWKLIDLLVVDPPLRAFVEFKYLAYRRTLDLDGAPTGNPKGGPGKKNEESLWKDFRKLRDFEESSVTDRYSVLVYERDTPHKKAQLSYHLSYRDLSPSGPVAEVWATSEGPLEARISQVVAASPGAT